MFISLLLIAAMYACTGSIPDTPSGVSGSRGGNDGERDGETIDVRIDTSLTEYDYEFIIEI